MLKISVRYYQQDGSFADSISTITWPNTIKDTLSFLLAPFEEEHKLMNPHWCNVMIRRNGKLISYKEFM